MAVISSEKRRGNAGAMKRWFFVWLMIFATFASADDGQKNDPTTLVFPSFLHTYGIRKATRFHLFLFTNNKVKFENPQGLAVARLNAWEDSTIESDDDEVTVYGVNTGQNNIIYNKSMKSIGVYGLDETGVQRLNEPHAIAANEWGDVYLTDSGNHRVVRLGNEANEVVFKASVGGLGISQAMFRTPRGIALDSKNNVYVADRDNNRIQVFSPDLEFRLMWRGLIGPDAIAVTDRNQQWTYYGEDFLVVVDSLNSRVRKYDLKGKFLGSISAAEMGVKEPYFAFIALDYYNNIYLTDTKNHCIHKMNHHLTYLTRYGRKGKGDKEFVEPRGIIIYRRFGQVFIAEKHGAQYYWVGTDCRDFEALPIPEARAVKFCYFLTEPSFVTADIFDGEEKLVTRLWTRRFKQTGTQQDIWDGRIFAVPDSVFKNEDIQPAPGFKGLKKIPNGRYKVRYKIEPTYSSYQYFEKMIMNDVKIEF